MNGRWAPHRDDFLENDEVTKRSFSYWAYSSPVFHNAAFLRLCAFFFDSSKKDTSNHLSSHITRHENNKVLYTSPLHADSAIQAGTVDYMFMLLTGCMIFSKPILGVSLALLSWKIPTRVMSARYFVLHAELMPHTEQVVFVKAALFGNREENVVDIKNLEKIDVEAITTGIVTELNCLNSNMIFRDKETGNVFMFSNYGLWNEETLKHPLLY